ncbi:hypothetical protein AB0L47_11495 [Streptomyces bobili]|uniref:hypothetical protein n=1 Tax=Streptomyces bobili TaxID=67280 RepID=UPI0034279DE1
MTQMPGAARCARALLVAAGTASVVALVPLAKVAATFEPGALGELILAMLLLAAVPLVALAVASFVLAAKFADGGDRVRLGAVVVGWMLVAGSAAAVPAHHGWWGAGVAVGALLTAFAGAERTREWFARPRLASAAHLEGETA